VSVRVCEFSGASRSRISRTLADLRPQADASASLPQTAVAIGMATSASRTPITNATTVIWCRRRTCHHTHVTWEVNGRTRLPRTRSPALQRTYRERPMWHGIEAVAAIPLGYFRRQMTRRWDNYCRTALFVQQRRMCATVGGALSETVATVSLRTKRMLSMFRLRNKKCSETGPNRRCSGPEQYQKQFRFDLYLRLTLLCRFRRVDLKTWCHPRDRKYITYGTVIRGGLSHSHS